MSQTLRILVGHKGTGKSALLRRAHEECLESGVLSVLVRPNDVSSALGHQAWHDLNQRIEQWKEGILKIVSRKAVEQFTGDSVDKIESPKISGGIKKVAKAVIETLQGIAPKYLEPAHAVLYQNFLKNGRIVVHIDDVDRGWTARYADIQNISALINALRDLGNSDPDFRSRIALRTDVYYLVRTSDESTDKIEQSIVQLRWKNDDILRMMAKRIVSYFSLDYPDVRIRVRTH